MLTRIGTPVASAVAAFALAIALSGAAVGVALVADTTPLVDENAPAIVDTHSTFEDVDGNGIDDDCQTDAAVADPEAEASAAAAIDLDKDGTISQSEAAKSDRVGGKNCNHGGYVSGVAKADGGDEDTEADTEEPKAECQTTEPASPTEAEDEDTGSTDETDAAADAANAHGKAVSDVAKSDAVGGKHCNHGGAVSEAAKGTKPDKAEKAAAKAAAKAEREAAKAARQHGHQGKSDGGGYDY